MPPPSSASRSATSVQYTYISRKARCAEGRGSRKITDMSLSVEQPAIEPLRVHRPDGATIVAEVIGEPRHPLVLLVAGADCSMDWWRPEFCAALAARGFRVVRYDQRGTGQTTPGDQGRGLPTAVQDALALLDALLAADAHWVGFSAGGWVAQLTAVEHPERVLALTLESTTPGFGDDGDLPGVSDRLMQRFAHPLPEPDWDDPASVIEYQVETERDYAGVEFDEAHVRAIWSATVRRDPRLHHDDLDDGSEEMPSWRERLSGLRMPTTVLHGTDDPLFPIGNGEALAREIPGARFVPLPGVGHELPPRVWDAVIDAIAH